MRILIQLGHPAHFHLYKNTARQLIADGHQVYILIKTKDILEDLLKEAGLPYYNILQVAHRKSKWGVMLDMLIRDWKIFVFCIRHKIDLLTGTSPEVAHIGWLLRKKAIVTTEDDDGAVPNFGKVIAPFVKCVLTPAVCNMGNLESRCSHYPSYHELAYLHPNHFTPSLEVASKYGIDTSKPYFVMRFASLNAHHDNGIKGINRDIAARLVEILRPHGQIYITSERPLEPEFEPYRIRINPLDMHHVMAFASLYIGDSQTMAAEAGVLGTPFVRFNDFVGRIGYLDELEEPLIVKNYTKVSDTNLHTGTDPLCKFRAPYLETITHHYNLGVGIKASEEGSVDRLCHTVESLVSMPAEERAKVYGERRAKMLTDKIDYAKFLTWFIENYPDSMNQSKNADATFWQQFK